MRIAIFSDVHANLNGLNAVLAAIEASGGADLIVAAGDLVTDGPRPTETFDRLVEAGCLMIRGNHDEHILGRGKEMIHPDKRENTWKQTMWARHRLGPERLALLEQQPLQRIFSPSPAIKGYDLMVVHANLKSVYGFTGVDQPSERLADYYGCAPSSVKVIAFGHWHGASIREWRGIRLVNVASVAYPVDRAKLAAFSFFSWDNLAGRWQIEQQRVPFDWREEAHLLRESDMPGDRWPLRYYFEPEPEEELVA